MRLIPPELGLPDLPAAATGQATLLLLLLPLPLIVVANWGASPPRGEGFWAERARAAGQISWLWLGLAVVLVAVLGLATLGRGALDGELLLVTAAAAGGLLWRGPREWIGRRVPIDPTNPVHTAALVLAVLIFGSQAAAQLSTDVLRQLASSRTSALDPLDLVLQELPFLAAALLGVGLLTRRSPGAALTRLGLVRPALWQVLLALAAAGALVAFTNGVDALSHRLTPDLAREVDAANRHLFGQLSNPLGVATIALSAGICEEALFRGALQPRLGLVATALLFTAVHSQYGLTLDALAVLGAALGLGLIRRYANTTSSTICHIVYDTLVGLQLGASWLPLSLALELALLALLGVAGTVAWSRRPGLR